MGTDDIHSLHDILAEHHHHNGLILIVEIYLCTRRCFSALYDLFKRFKTGFFCLPYDMSGAFAFSLSGV